DHWDEAAQNALPKSLPIFVQNRADAAVIAGQGFTDLRLLSESPAFKGVNLVKTAGRHGSEAHYEAIGALLGEVCGVVFSAPGQKTVYLAGDTVWNADVAAALATHRPAVAILNCGAAMIEGMAGSIIMDAEDVLRVHRAAPEALLIATHLEAVNHCVLTRAELRAFAQAKGFAAMLRTPGDGERIDI
ncbi:MAG: MBL fold metallo-hydrolase, partial [Gemmobacter sp.]|uniref:MBL fold metallo-hydrolase n=1 Tax=Gemmobacter sp. TaxID=1898957 RepID=UPI001A402134